MTAGRMMSHQCMTTADHDGEAPACECFWTDPSTWLSAASCGYGGGYEPGSQMEWNPDCPAHPPAREVWDDRAAPGGFVCSTCGMPSESEPCEHLTTRVLPPAETRAPEAGDA